jgi:2-polyprenyl-3-methyl-5-hydroxy-6-metoxy-1,4-benzoquinol methylase
MSKDQAHDHYDAYYFAHCCGRPYRRDERWLNFFGIIAQRLIDYLHPETVLDAGCAMGFLVEGFRDRGIDAFGFDVSKFALDQVRDDIKPFCELASITDSLTEKYDLITCIEVLEHLSPIEGIQAIANLCKNSENILFTSTPFDDDEPTHRNVQPPEYWAQLFAAESFYRDVEFDASFITPWAILFRKGQPCDSYVVKAYERKFWSLWKANVDLRALAVKYQGIMATDEQRLGSIQSQLASLSERFGIEVTEEDFGQQIVEWIEQLEAD